MPKEMLPLVDKPIIQYAIEEAVAAGIEQMILVTARGKTAMVDHFDVDVELETFLEDRGKIDQLAAVRHVSTLARLAAVRQGPPLGLGHAVLITRDLVCDQPFAVVLGDDVIDADPPAIRQLVDVYDKVRGRCSPSNACRWTRSAATASSRPSRWATASIASRTWSRSPRATKRPPTSRSSARYVLTPDIFPVLAGVREDRTGEIQLTSGLRELLRQRPIYACEVQGTRHDTGNKLGFLKATMYFAMQRGICATTWHVPAVAARRCRARHDATPSAWRTRASS